jgi:hypothetical protein
MRGGSIDLVPPLVMAYVITFVLRFVRKQSSFGSDVVTGISEEAIGGKVLVRRCRCGLDKDDFGSSVYLAEVLV